jgi:phage terminase large subunit GpA-like protein
MNCPKCGGEAYLADEEFVRVIENVEPMKVVAKAIYQCRSCGEKFSRLMVENIDAKKASAQSRPQGIYSGQTYGSASSQPGASSAQPNPMGEEIDPLRFF